MTRRFSGPLIPGTRSVKQKGGRRYLASRAKYSKPFRSTYKLIKGVALSQCETKTANQRYAGGSNAQPLFHNTSDFWENLLATTQGTDDPQGVDQYLKTRVGNDIIARGLKLRMMFISSPERPNLNLMVYVYRYNSKTPQQAAVFWSGPSGSGATNNRFLDHPNTDRVKIIRKFVVQNQNSAEINNQGTVHTVYREIYINMKNRKIKYDNDTGNGDVPMFTDIGICVTAFDATNTLASDEIAYWTASSQLYFKDP